ncbi:hypothetical protein GCM10027446_20460 [Angustibacter peucedani]
MERARFIDMNDRVRTARRVQGGSMSLAVLVSAPTYSWWLVVLVAVALLALGALEKVPEGTVSLERASAASMALLMVVLGIGVLLSGGVRSPFLAFLAVPTLMLAARFRPTVFVVGVGMSVLVAGGAMLGAAAIGPAPDAPWWVWLGAYAALLAALTAISITLLTAELQSRGDAVVDPLTGLFNRKALAGRYAEAAAQARVLGGSVSVVLCDLDHFKRVNDQHGHDVGDVVLREAAYRMRKTLRTFDLVYRIGGEEFLVLLPGQDLVQAVTVAERMVADVASEPLGGLAVTMSAGVAETVGGHSLLDELMKRADVALYAAKDAGRNQVCVDGRLSQPA